MKLSNDTIEILKNFSSINPNLVIKPEPRISTIAEAKNIFATAEIAEEFPDEIGIYDLNEFLNVLGLYSTTAPELSFEARHMEINDGNYRVNYRFADPSILTAPSKKITMPEVNVEVTISSDILAHIRKAAGVLGHSIVSFRGNDGLIELEVVDPKQSTSNTFAIVLDEKNACKDTFDLQFLISNLKVLNGNYKVELSSKLISHWCHEDIPVEYYIALEKTSSFGA